MRIIATIGNESHTTSSGWGKLSVNGKQLSHRDAKTKEFQTKFGDKHAMWVECGFEVPEGATITWEAGANAGSRGSERTRQNLTFVADPTAEIFETKSVGYPASSAKLQGRLRLVNDANKEKASAHADWKNNL